ncbi:MAG: hypothetical protein OHK0015_54770 [Chloroflexi bacterium OHK40]
MRITNVRLRHITGSMPVDGMITVPTAPGMGMELDEAKIETERELRRMG